MYIHIRVLFCVKIDVLRSPLDMKFEKSEKQTP